MNRKIIFDVDRYRMTGSVLSPVRIVSLSDLHGKLFGADLTALHDLVLHENPDIVVFVGDMVDSHLHGLADAIGLAESLAKKVPVFAVLGNHERRSGDRKSVV